MNVHMDNFTTIHKFVVDGDDAERLFEIFKKSYLVENSWQPFEDYTLQVDFSYADGVFRVEEKNTGNFSFIADILCFFADRDNIYSLSEYIEDGVTKSYSVDDEEGKYFVRPPKTEGELQKEQKRINDDDLPF